MLNETALDLDGVIFNCEKSFRKKAAELALIKLFIFALIIR